MMRGLGRKYAKYFNFRCKRSATLWKEYFRAHLTQKMIGDTWKATNAEMASGREQFKLQIKALRDGKKRYQSAVFRSVGGR
jgi:hypothetical protein